MADHDVSAGDVAVMPLSDGAFGACQVTGVRDDVIAAYALDWHSAAPPTLDDLRDADPLVLDHHMHHGRAAHICIGRWQAIPPDFMWIGSLPVPAQAPEFSNTFSGWDSLADDVIRQLHWDQQLPEEAKAAYQAAASRGQVDVDFGAGPVTIGAALHSLDLASGRPVPVPATGAVNWSALDRLPRCTSLTWAGPDRGISGALGRQPIIMALTWHDAPAIVDLTATALTSLTISGRHLRELRLPRTLRTLELIAPHGHLAVDAADGGRWQRLAITEADTQTRIPQGLHNTRSVDLDGAGVLSAATLAALPELRTLAVRWRQAPGKLSDTDGLTGLSQLVVVELIDGYGVDAATLPDLPALTHLALSGVRKSVVAAVKARYRGTPTRLEIHGAKPDVWLAANLNNPLRDWIDDHPQGGKAACKAYAQAVRAIDRLSPGFGQAALELILKTLVDALNGVEQRYEIIDTMRREQAWDAFAALAARAGLDRGIASEWFDDWRDF